MQLFLPLEKVVRRVFLRGRKVGMDPSMHHLALVNGVWCVRVTIDRGPKLVGERIKESLGTGDVDEAKTRRDIFIHGLKKGGAKIAKNNVWSD